MLQRHMENNPEGSQQMKPQFSPTGIFQLIMTMFEDNSHVTVKLLMK